MPVRKPALLPVRVIHAEPVSGCVPRAYCYKKPVAVSVMLILPMTDQDNHRKPAHTIGGHGGQFHTPDNLIIYDAGLTDTGRPVLRHC